MSGVLVPDTRELYLRSKRTRDYHLDMARQYGNTVKGRRHIALALSAAKLGNAMLALHRSSAR